MSRYDEHLCAVDPAAWEDGFAAGAPWAQRLAKPASAEVVYQAIRWSSGVPFPVTAAKVGLPPTPWVEGFLLRVFAEVAARQRAGPP